jgi:hypothetical protein
MFGHPTMQGRRSLRAEGGDEASLRFPGPGITGEDDQPVGEGRLSNEGGRIFRFHPQPSQQENAKKGRVQVNAPAQEDPHPAVQAKQ